MVRPLVFPRGLELRGKRLWKDVLAVRPQLGPGERVLLEEACRLADRLERLNDQIQGGSCGEVVTEDGRTFVLLVGNAMGEARLTTTALRGVMISLGLEKQVPVAPPQPARQDKGDGKPEQEADPIDELNARRNKDRGTGT